MSYAKHLCVDDAKAVQISEGFPQNADLTSEPCSADEDHDCHCPTHRTTCCHFSFVPAEMSDSTYFVFSQVSDFSESVATVPSGPTPDGPFQPPRI